MAFPHRAMRQWPREAAMSLSPQLSSERWGRRAVRGQYGTSGYLEAGEQAAFASADLEQAEILDLAVGGGRTTSFLAPDAARYVGIDISPQMVELARGRFPGVDLRVGDLRELSGFADASFDAVVVSYNSIDALPREDRAPTLREFHRVLVPRGHLVLSMLNLPDGPPEAPSLRDLTPFLRPGPWRSPRWTAKRVGRALKAFWYYRGAVGHTEEGPDWAVRPLRAHEFRFVVHFSRFGAAVRTLRDAGFAIDGAWASDGEVLDLEAERVDVDYMHFHCRAAKG
jgi:SAM-dependent methyltransferase